MKGGWIGVDLDRTLARYDKWQGPYHVGEPIPLMVERIKKWLLADQEVRIFTARVANPEKTWERFYENQIARRAIEAWCIAQFGVALPVTCEKDFDMLELWDDRAIQVVPNSGERVDGVSD